MPNQKHYKAFISYSHDDEEFGSWLHKELEKYKIPKKLQEDYPNLPKTLYPIFQDQYELNAGDDLGVEILFPIIVDGKPYGIREKIMWHPSYFEVLSIIKKYVFYSLYL